MVRMCTRRGPMVLCLVLAAAVALGLPRVGHSQVLYGLLTGTVRDTQGGALTGVTVTANNSGTGLRLETVTDAAGAYTFRNMPTGSYDLAASLAGFRPLKLVGLPITAGKNVRVDLTLELGGLSETVEVRAESSIMQTEKSDLSTELTAKQLVALPLNQYRNYQSLFNLIPGATPTQFQGAEIDTPGRSLRTWVNGVQPNSNTTRVDGAVSINIWLPHFAGYIQPAETIETVNVSTNAFDADQGMAAGMAQTVITKSGTNQFRGSGFWFGNRDELNANSFLNKKTELAKPNLDTNIYGGTLGGPIRKNKLFFFGGYEMFRDRRGVQATYGVPTAKMREGDFSEVAAAYANFRLYDPLSSSAPAGRTQFPGFVIPADRISSIAKKIIPLYPMPSSKDLDSDGLLDHWVNQQVVKVDRANYDLKLTFQRSPSHSIWGKLSMMDATVVDNYMLGWKDGSVGDTRVYVGGLGHTWTLGPTLVLDGNFGYNRQDQTVKGPDYETNYGLDFGIPGVNDPNDIRASGMVGLANGYVLGGESWRPAFRKEITYSFSSALTKVFTGHEIRSGVDVVRMELNHRQAEIGWGGLHGGFVFSGNVTGAPGYARLPWNRFAEFLMGLAYQYTKDVQTEDMTGREWQTGLYVRDRWRVNSRLTLNLGLRAEYYPLMTRAHSGIERLLYDSYEMILGGRGGQPTDVGIQLREWYLAPRVGTAYRLTERSVLRAGYGRTINPLPWSRPMRGGFPYDIAFGNTAEQFGWVTTLAAGIPPVVPIPDYQSGKVKVPAGVVVNSPNPTNVDRATIQQWNVTFERRLPLGIVADVAYVGTATDGGYAFLNVNHGEPGGGNTSRKYYPSAGNTAVNDFRSCLKSRYHGLQVSFSRLRQDGLMLQGAYTLSRARDMAGAIIAPDEDGWTGLAWNHPMMYEENFATAGFDRTHVLHVGFGYDLPFFRDSKNLGGVLLGGWQVAGVFSAYSGTPFSVPGTNTALNCPDCGAVTIDVRGKPEPTGDVGVGKAWYDKALFSQPTGATKAGFGNSGRNVFRRPSVWNVNMGICKAFRAGRLQPELRIDVANIFDTVNWGTPVISFGANSFMQFVPESADNGTGSTGTPGARSVRIGVRMEF